MSVAVVITFVNILSTILIFAIIIRALLSWIMPGRGNQAARVLSDITEPVLAPIRRALPPVGGIDFSPILAMILISLVKYMVTGLLQAAV